MSNHIGEALKAGRIAKGLSQNEVARTLKVSRAAVGQWERGDTAPSTYNLIEICRLLSLNLEMVTNGETKFVTAPPGSIGNEKPITGIVDIRKNNSALDTQDDEHKIPESESHIYAFSMNVVNDDGDFTIITSEFEIIRRPLDLRMASSAYAVYVATDTMAPRYEVGELIILAPTRPAKIGDYVLVQENTRVAGRLLCKLGRLASRSGAGIRLEQLNPYKEITLAPDDVVHIHRILPTAEILG